MATYDTILYYFGLYFLFMLAFFVVLCLFCLICILWYRRNHGEAFSSNTEPNKEETPLRIPSENNF